MAPASPRFDAEGRFVVNDYNRSPLFSSFLPGIAGKDGVPLWAFTVNRGQAVSSFGVRNKDGAILEFFPADRAYQTVTLRGFRTFLKVTRGGKTFVHEPFQPGAGAGVEQRLLISPHEVTVEETYARLGLRARATMFTLPNAPIAALLRIITVENLSPKPADVRFVDGLPLLLSCGLNQWCVKYMSRTMEAFAVAENVEEGAPFLRLKVLPADSEKVVPVVSGHFFAGWSESGRAARRLKALVDPRPVFGGREDFTRPEAFFDGVPAPKEQRIGNRNPAGLLEGAAKAAPKGSFTLYSLYGQAPTLAGMNAFLKTVSPAYFREKREENAALIRSITAPSFAATASTALNAYARQCFLDNGLRGGFPSELPGGRPVYLFGRKHGDPERDYNDFFIQDTPYSEGNGDFRDMLQNRRVDLIFQPSLEDRNVKYFFGLIQADGYNPLVLRNTRFVLRDAARAKALLKDRGLSNALEALEKPFKFSALWSALGGASPSDRAVLAADILSLCGEIEDAEFEKGYWSDHWTYLLDLLESYKSVYPDRLVQALLDDPSYPFYDGAYFVKPRSRKYVLTDNGARQYGAVAYDKEKDKVIKSRAEAPHRARAGRGRGTPVLTTLLGKILTLILNKLASLDPSCAGVEMEADRPGWCDALNGLPSLFGSAMNETFELQRLVKFTHDALRSAGRGGGVRVPAELGKLFEALRAAVEGGSWSSDPFRFWEETHRAKETYREQVFQGFDGAESQIPFDALDAFLDKTLSVLDRAARRGRRGDQVITYFSHEAVKHEPLEGGFIRVTEFKQKPLPLFLEGFVHAMRVSKTPEESRALHRAVRGTELLDKKLGMYRLNVPLGGNAMELGRTGVFSYGWLENGSIFLHMHYKYVLEMARRGLLEEFYADMKQLLVPFRDPRQYGRSIVENASFIASSGYKDKEDHGRAFVARLSGSTVEYLHLWSHLLFGPAPFGLAGDGGLELRFSPSLAKDLFLSKPASFEDGGSPLALPKDSLAFRFLGKTLVVYHNPARRDTFGPKPARPAAYELFYSDGRKETVQGAALPAAQALAVREGRVSRLDVTLRP